MRASVTAVRIVTVDTSVVDTAMIDALLATAV
jgi:hypothetical protein